VLTSLGVKESIQRQLKTLDERTRRLDLLHRVARSLTHRMSLEQLLDKLLRLCAEAFELGNCALLLLDDGGAKLHLKASIGYSDDAPQSLAVGEGITGHVVATGVPVLVADVTKDPRYIAGVTGARSEMAAPLRVFDRVIGALDAESSGTREFNEDDLDLFTSFAAQAAVAIYSADVAARLEEGGGLPGNA
jgi:GAF domain-containing protein